MFRLKYYLRSYFATQHTDTIFAVSTNSYKPSPINVLRVSGSEAYKCLSLLSKKDVQIQNKQQVLEKFKIKPRYAHNATLYTQDKTPIDKCLLLYFAQGKSYNGEDIFEFHLHGSPAVLKLMFKQLFKLGFRIAEPGQFTKRALVNGKMNVLQVEGLHDLIHSENEFSRRIAMNHILGQTSKLVEDIKDRMMSCLAACHAFIEFQQTQSDVTADVFQNTRVKVFKIAEDLNTILQSRKQIQAVTNGINIVIVGKPNAGKSTIMNKLVKEDVAIVSQQPGTTRDIVKASFEYKGLSFNLSDTAGIRETDQKVQKQGIRRAIQKTKQSHFNILIIDGGSQQILSTNDKTIITLKQFQQDIFENDKTIIILNKTDLIQSLTNKDVFVRLNNLQRPVDVSISALNDNIDTILECLTNKVKQIYNMEDHKQQILLTRQRHFKCIERCLHYIEGFINATKADIAAEQMSLAIEQIGKVVGRVDVEDVLDVLFKDFCIGK